MTLLLIWPFTSNLKTKGRFGIVLLRLFIWYVFYCNRIISFESIGRIESAPLPVRASFRGALLCVAIEFRVSAILKFWIFSKKTSMDDFKNVIFVFSAIIYVRNRWERLWKIFPLESMRLLNLNWAPFWKFEFFKKRRRWMILKMSYSCSAPFFMPETVERRNGKFFFSTRWFWHTVCSEVRSVRINDLMLWPKNRSRCAGVACYQLYSFL